MHADMYTYTDIYIRTSTYALHTYVYIRSAYVHAYAHIRMILWYFLMMALKNYDVIAHYLSDFSTHREYWNSHWLISLPRWSPTPFYYGYHFTSKTLVIILPVVLLM